MSVKRIIPITPIMLRYQTLRKMSQAERLAEANRLLDEPWELAGEFAQSVLQFSAYKNLKDHFYPPARAKRDFADEVKRTNDLVLRLEDQKHVVPVDAPTRITVHGAGPRVSAVPAALLAFDYVDRELLVQRTTSPAQWEDGTHNRGGVRLDVLLADAADRTPIVGELKLPGDMDPFFALIQALACAAHLATPNQYERMRSHLYRGAFPTLSGPPRLDVWVLFVDPPGYDPGQPPKGRYMADLKTAAETLAPALLAYHGMSQSIRRIAGLGVGLDAGGTVTADIRWAWEADVDSAAQLWTPFGRHIPNADLTPDVLPPRGADWGQIAQFAKTLDGYRAAGGSGRLGVVANQWLDMFRQTGQLPQDLTALRAALWFEHRRDHHNESSENPETIRYVHAVLDAIWDIVERRS